MNKTTNYLSHSVLISVGEIALTVAVHRILAKVTLPTGEILKRSTEEAIYQRTKEFIASWIPRIAGKGFVGKTVGFANACFFRGDLKIAKDAIHSQIRT